MKIGASVFVMIWCISFVGCLHTDSNIYDSNSKEITIIESQSLDNQEYKATLKNQPIPTWQVKNVPFPKGASNESTKLYFFDEKVGFIATSEGRLFKTTNSGKIWSLINIPVDSAIEDIHFADFREGFLIVNKTAPIVLEEINNESYILKTEDGGLSWKNSYIAKSSTLERIIFLSNEIGVAIGMKISMSPNFRQTHLFLLTEDGGKTWTDLSENLNKLAFSQKENSSDYLTDIHLDLNKEISVLSLRGSVFRTLDNGKTWQESDQLGDEPQQTCLCRLDRVSDNYVIGGGAESNEGVWGVISFQKKSNKWEKFRLNGYYFSDVKFISETEIIASGAVNSKGVILFSSDKGKTWEILNTSSKSNIFNSISVISKNNIIISGNKGNIISLTRN